MAIGTPTFLGGNSGTTSTVAISSLTVTASHSLIVFIGFQDLSGGSITSVVYNDGSDNYNLVERYSGSLWNDYAIYSLDNVTAASGSGSITVTMAGTHRTAFRAHAVSGLDTTNSFDRVAAASARATSFDSGTSALTSRADEVVFGFLYQADSGTTITSLTGTVTDGEGYTDNTTQGSRIHTAYKIVSSAGTYDFTGDLSAKEYYAAVVATFKAAYDDGVTDHGTGYNVDYSVSITGLTVTDGNGLIACTTSREGYATESVVYNDGGGDQSFTKVESQVSGTYETAIWVLYSADGSAGSGYVTYTTAVDNNKFVHLFEVENLKDSGFDKSSSDTSTGTSQSSGTTTTTSQAAEVIVGAHGIASLSSNFTAIGGDAVDHCAYDDSNINGYGFSLGCLSVVDATGTFESTATNDNSSPWMSCIATFELDSGGQTATPSDNLSTEWDETLVALRTLLSDIDESITLSEALLADLDSRLEDDLSGAWDEEYVFGLTFVSSDDVSNDWDEVYTFAFGTFQGDSLTFTEGLWADITTIVEESVTLSEILLADLDSVIAESITLAEELDATVSAKVDESITLAEVLLANLDSILAESITLTEVLLGGLNVVIPESVTFSDEYTWALTANISDTLTFATDGSIWDGTHAIYTQDDDFLLAQDGDELEYQWSPGGETATPSDSLTLTEVLLANLDSIVAESITLSELLVGDLDSIVAESITLSEVLISNLDSIIEESITLSEVLISNLDSIIEESFTLSEVLVSNLDSIVIESITLDDQMNTSGQASTSIPESITLTEVYVLDLDSLLAESITLSEVLTANLDSLLSESITLTEGLDASLDSLLEESITLSELLVSNLDSILVETITLSSILTTTPTALIEESITLAEALVANLDALVAESITLDEELLADEAGVADLYDTLSFGSILHTEGGVADERIILAQDGDLIAAQDDSFIEYQYRTEDAILTQDGYDLQTQDGQEILLQGIGIVISQPLTLDDSAGAFGGYIREVLESFTLSGLMETLAITDDAFIDESITLSDQLVADRVPYPLYTQEPEIIRDADGFTIEVQYEEDFVAPSDTLSLTEVVTTVHHKLALVHETLPFTSVITTELGEPEAIVYGDTLYFYEDLLPYFTVAINESLTLNQFVFYGVKGIIHEQLWFLDWGSVADEFQYLHDYMVLSDLMEPVWSEYTGAVFVMNDWYSFFSALLSDLDETLTLVDELVGTGQYTLVIDTLGSATEEDRITPWTEEDGTVLSEEHGYVDLTFNDLIQLTTFYAEISDTIRFVDDDYTQEYVMPCSNPTGPCTTEVTGDCIAPQTLGTFTNALTGVSVDSNLYYLTVSWTAQAVSEYVRVFFRQQGTQEKWSTILADIVDGSVETPYKLESGVTYDVLVRHESATKYSSWQVFTVTMPDYDDTLTLAETVALRRDLKRSKTDSLLFSGSYTLTVN